MPRSTLNDKISGRVVQGTNPGPSPYLVAAEEIELSLFLIDTPKQAMEKLERTLKDWLRRIDAQDKGVLKTSKVTNGWFRRFLERQPTLSL